MSGELRVEELLLFDVSTRTQIEVTGRDRVKILHSFCTNDIKKLQPGQGCEAFVTNVNGKVLGHLFAFAERESLWLESVADAGSALLTHFDKYVITEDVRFTDRSAEFSELLLVGPQGTDLLERLDMSISTLPRYGHLTHGSPTLPLRSVRRVDWIGSPSWLLSMPTADRATAESTLLAAGAQRETDEAFHALRIATGFPLFGIDITEDNLAQEVCRTELAISFTKGCYLGQEPIARIDAMGHVNRQLCRLEIVSDAPIAAGTPVLDPAAEGKVIGAVTSSSTTNALAYLRSAFAVAGRQVTVDGRAATVL